MKKSDLKTGMRVKVRIGQIYLVIRDIQHVDGHQELAFISNCGFIKGSNYDDGLINTISFSSSFDVMEVYTINENPNNLLTSCTLDLDKRFSIWKRQEYTDRQEEIFKALKVLGFNYVARDDDGDIYTYQEKPLKIIDYCNWNDHCNSFELINGIEKVFDFIKWEDTEPFEIPNL